MNNTNFKSTLYKFYRHINNFIGNENKNYIKRNRKIDLYDTFLYKLLSNHPNKILLLHQILLMNFGKNILHDKHIVKDQIILTYHFMINY